MFRGILRTSTAFCLALLCLNATALGQDQVKTQKVAAQTVFEIQRLQSELSAQNEVKAQIQSDLQKLKHELSAQKEARVTIIFWVQVLAGVVILVSFLAFSLQVYTLRAEARSQRRNQEESAAQKKTGVTSRHLTHSNKLTS